MSEQLLKEYAEELEVQRDEVLKTSEKIRQMVLSLPDAAFVIDENGCVEFWNSAIEEMTGFSAEQMVGKCDYEYAIPFYGERRPILIDLVRLNDKILEEKYSGIIRKNNILQAETYVPSLRGTERYLVGTATALLDSNGKYLGAIEIIHDITERQYHLREIEEQRQNIIKSIRYARHIQEALLPSLDNLKVFFNDYFLFFKPRDIVSGDFYFTRTIENKIIITVADCTGHGVPGALMSMIGISFIGQIISQSENIATDSILNKLRKMLLKHLGTDFKGGQSTDGMDMSLIIFDKDNMTIEYSGAYNSIFVVTENQLDSPNIRQKREFNLPDTKKKLFEIRPDKMPVGDYISIKPFSKNKFRVNNGDKIYLFTDGFPDLFDYKENKKYTMRRFKELLLKTADMSLQEQLKIIQQTYDDWLGGIKQIDDLTLLGIEV